MANKQDLRGGLSTNSAAFATSPMLSTSTGEMFVVSLYPSTIFKLRYDSDMRKSAGYPEQSISRRPYVWVFDDMAAYIALRKE